MQIKRPLIYLLCFLCPLIFLGQIKVSEKIQDSYITTQDENALYFVDFWATWCMPCIHVSKYLESLQRQYPDNFYILSLSQENPEVVKRFMKKHKMDLAIAIDYQGETFQKNNIQSLPYGILYNAKGEKLWEGHPAEFKAHHIKKFLRENKKKIAVDKMFKSQSYKKEFVSNIEIPKKDFEYSKIRADKVAEIQAIKKRTYIELQGTLQDILAYSFNVFKDQIKIPSALNKSYKMSFKLKSEAYLNMSKTILEALKLNQFNSENEGEALIFNLKKPTFWDTRQIDWGTDSQAFLIGDSDIQADNVTLNQVKYQLATLLKTPIVISNENLDNKLHDWQIHYKYFDLMASSFKDNYGIQIEKKIVKYPQYIITKKTP